MHAWAQWSRGWTAEEKRHGDVTRTYLYLSGRLTDGKSRRLFQNFADLGRRIGVYGLRDDADNVEGFVAELQLETLGGLGGAAEQQRDEICALPTRYRESAHLLDRQRVRPATFRWIHGRSA